MASPLTITTSTAGIPTTRSFGASGREPQKEDDFAVMLGASAADEPVTPAAAVQPASNDVNLSTGFDREPEVAPEDLEAVAALLETPVILAPAETAKPKLSELVEGLAALKAKLAAGEMPDPKMLEELDGLLTGLAQQLGIDLAKMPTADDLAGLVASPEGAEDSFAARLVEAFGPLAGDLVGHTAPAADEQLSAEIRALGNKLAALLAALNAGDLDDGALADLQENAATDTALQAALESALKPTIAQDAQPVLAKPELKLTEPVLTGKDEPEAAPASTELAEAGEPEPSSLAVKPAAAGDSDKPADSGKEQAHDRNQGDANPAVVAAATGDKQADIAAAPQPVPAARVDAVAAPRVVQTGYQTSQQQLNLPQLAFEMARQVQDGNSRFQIRLDPAELGKIDVRLDIDASGQVNARLTVEKAETLDLMQRDQRALERALQQAGLDSSKTSLEFSLKQNPFGGGQQGRDGRDRNPFFGGEPAETAEAPLPAINLYRGSLSASGVNIIA